MLLIYRRFFFLRKENTRKSELKVGITLKVAVSSIYEKFFHESLSTLVDASNAQENKK